MKKLLTYSKLSSSAKGFTIIELMIAITVFSLILLVLTLSVISIARLYDKGIVQANTQNTTRDVTTELTQAIQFSTVAPSTEFVNPPTNSQGVLCIGGNSYAFDSGQELNGSNTVLKSLAMACTGNAAGDYGTLMWWGRELLAPNMRLADISIKLATVSQPDLYQITVRIVYGANDLVCSPAANDCHSALAKQFAPDLICKVQSGSQFCAESDLTSYVALRK